MLTSKAPAKSTRTSRQKGKQPPFGSLGDERRENISFALLVHFGGLRKGPTFLLLTRAPIQKCSHTSRGWVLKAIRVH